MGDQGLDRHQHQGWQGQAGQQQVRPGQGLAARVEHHAGGQHAQGYGPEHAELVQHELQKLRGCTGLDAFHEALTAAVWLTVAKP